MPDLTPTRVAEIIAGLPEGCASENTGVVVRQQRDGSDACVPECWVVHGGSDCNLSLVVDDQCMAIVRWLNERWWEVRIDGASVDCVSHEEDFVTSCKDTLLESLAACVKEVAGGE